MIPKSCVAGSPASLTLAYRGTCMLTSIVAAAVSSLTNYDLVSLLFMSSPAFVLYHLEDSHSDWG